MARLVHLSALPHRALSRYGLPRVPNGAPAGQSSTHRVITPNRRAAHWLGVSPRTLEDLAFDRLRAAGRTVVSPFLAHRALRAAVREALNSSDPDGMARLLQPALRAVFRAGGDLDALAGSPSPRTARLARIGVAYRARLRAQGLIDPAEVLTEAAALARTAPTAGPPLLIYGYPRLGADEQAFLAAAGDGSVLVLPGADAPLFQDNLETAEWLKARGWEIGWDQPSPTDPGERLARRFVGDRAGATGGPAEDGPTDKPTRALAYPHLEAEVRGALAAVKALLADGVRPDEVVVVARDDAFYGPTALAVAREYGLPLRALYAIPLSETRLGAWLRQAFAVALDDFPYEPTVQLLWHPFGPGLPTEAWGRARQRRPGGAAQWQALGADLGALTWPAEASRAAFVQRLRELLAAVDLRNKTAAWAREAQAFRQLSGELATLAVLDPTESPGGTLTLRAFAGEVEALLAALTVPAEAGRAGVELHTPLSLYGARYRHLFVLGLAEGTLPRPVQDDPALDFFERRRLVAAGVPLETPDAAARREALSFWSTLLAGAEQVTLSYPRLLGDQEVLRSPFFERCGLAAVADEAESDLVASPEEARRAGLRRDRATADPVLAHARVAWAIERRRESPAPPDEHDGCIDLPLDPASRRFSATQLVALGQCPFKWLAGYGLRLAEIDEAEPDLAADVRGNLYHRTLELALKEATAAGPPADLRAAALDHLEAAFAAAEKTTATARLPAWAARRGEHLRLLRRAIQSPDFLLAGATVCGCEQTFEGKWFDLPVRGKVDRVDRGPNGLLLYDYKTSRRKPPGAQDSTGQAKLDVQLPLYLQVAAPVLYPGETVTSAQYFSLTGARTLAKATANVATLSAFAEQVKQRLHDGAYPVAPDTRREACKYCDFDRLCRQGPRLERKQEGS